MSIKDEKTKEVLTTLKAYLICCITSDVPYSCSECPSFKGYGVNDSCTEKWTDDRFKELIKDIDAILMT